MAKDPGIKTGKSRRKHMSNDTFFKLEVSDNLAVVTFHRPPINMISFQALGQLESILYELKEQKDLSIVLITSDVEGYFAAHADVDDVMRMENKQPPIGDPDAWDRVNELLWTMPQITVAAVNGQAWGGGCELALACDFILLSECGHLRLLEISKGVVPGAGGTQRLPRRIGVKRALRMLVTSEIISGKQAIDWGLADALLPEKDFMDHVHAWIEPILKQPIHSVQAAKRVVMQGNSLPLSDGLALEKSVFQELVSSEETKAMGEKTVETL